MNAPSDPPFRVLELIAPGTAVREGLDRIVQGRTGALITLGSAPALDALITGGFTIDVPFSAAALCELAKMDGAIVLNEALDRILHAGVQLTPDAAVASDEIGTRHRTADRVARQTGVPTVTVSSSMATISLFVEGSRWLVHRPEQLLARANQALATLARYRDRLGEAAARLSSAEVADTVTVRDVALIGQRIEMVRRLRHEVRGYVIELGTEGRLLRLQVQELVSGLDELADRVEHDYRSDTCPLRLGGLAAVDTPDLADPTLIAQACGLGDEITRTLRPLGHRQLAEIVGLPSGVAGALVARFGDLQGLLGATTADLLSVDGVDYPIARTVREGLIRLAESAYS